MCVSPVQFDGQVSCGTSHRPARIRCSQHWPQIWGMPVMNINHVHIINSLVHHHQYKDIVLPAEPPSALSLLKMNSSNSQSSFTSTRNTKCFLYCVNPLPATHSFSPAKIFTPPHLHIITVTHAVGCFHLTAPFLFYKFHNEPRLNDLHCVVGKQMWNRF